MFPCFDTDTWFGWLQFSKNLKAEKTLEQGRTYNMQSSVQWEQGLGNFGVDITEQSYTLWRVVWPAYNKEYCTFSWHES